MVVVTKDKKYDGDIYIMTVRLMFYYDISSLIQKYVSEIMFDYEEPPYLDIKLNTQFYKP